MSLLPALVFLILCSAQDAPQQKPEPAPQEEKKPEEKPPLQEPEPQPAFDEPWLLDVHAGLRIGGWRTGSFDALTPLGQRKLESTLLFDAGLDLKAVYSGWSLSLTADYGTGKNISMEMGGLLVGMEIALAPEPMPLDLQIAIGPIFGRLDVDVSGFGSFKSAVGLEARVAATSWLNERIGLSLWVDYRHLSFKYDEPVTSGDASTGGSTFAVGAGLVMRF